MSSIFGVVLNSILKLLSICYIGIMYKVQEAGEEIRNWSCTPKANNSKAKKKIEAFCKAPYLVLVSSEFSLLLVSLPLSQNSENLYY